MATGKTSRREPRLAPGQPGGREYPGQPYIVLLITKTKDTKHDARYTSKRVGHTNKTTQYKDVLALLKKLAPRKTTTAVAVTKSGKVHAEARGRKLVRVDKVSQKIARTTLTAKHRHRAKDGTKFFQHKKTSKR